jgi:hypothetical protein
MVDESGGQDGPTKADKRKTKRKQKRRFKFSHSRGGLHHNGLDR